MKNGGRGFERGEGGGGDGERITGLERAKRCEVLSVAVATVGCG